MEGRNVVAMPFKVAAAFLFLIFLWGFVGEEMSMSNPVSYEYEHTKKDHAGIDSNELHAATTHGSYMPWRQHIRDRHIHYDTSHIRVGERVELVNLTSRPDLNGVTGRVMEYNGKVYTVRLVHGIGRFRLKPDNIKPFASKSTAAPSGTNPLEHSSVHLLTNHTSTETLNKIEQMIKPQHTHLENTHSKAHRHHSNKSSVTTRFIILFILVVVFCSYGYSEFPDETATNLSIKCPPPPSEYVFVDADEENQSDVAQNSTTPTAQTQQKSDDKGFSDIDLNDMNTGASSLNENFEMVSEQNS